MLSTPRPGHQRGCYLRSEWRASGHRYDLRRHSTGQLQSAAEEAQLELDQLLQQFDEWKKDNKGGWRDFLKDNKDETKVKRINLKDGGNGESSFAQLADDYEDDIQVIYIDGVKEDFGSYVKRMGGIKDE